MRGTHAYPTGRARRRARCLTPLLPPVSAAYPPLRSLFIFFSFSGCPFSLSLVSLPKNQKNLGLSEIEIGARCSRGMRERLRKFRRGNRGPVITQGRSRVPPPSKHFWSTIARRLQCSSTPRPASRTVFVQCVCVCVSVRNDSLSDESGLHSPSVRIARHRTRRTPAAGGTRAPRRSSAAAAPGRARGAQTKSRCSWRPCDRGSAEGRTPRVGTREAP